MCVDKGVRARERGGGYWEPMTRHYILCQELEILFTYCLYSSIILLYFGKEFIFLVIQNYTHTDNHTCKHESG